VDGCFDGFIVQSSRICSTTSPVAVDGNGSYSLNLALSVFGLRLSPQASCCRSSIIALVFEFFLAFRMAACSEIGAHCSELGCRQQGFFAFSILPATELVYLKTSYRFSVMRVLNAFVWNTVPTHLTTAKMQLVKTTPSLFVPSAGAV
jgi:hypothetical protein